MGKLTLVGILIIELGLGMMAFGLKNENSREYLGEAINGKSYVEMKNKEFAKAQGKKIKARQVREISAEENYLAQRDLKIFGSGIVVAMLGSLVTFAGARGTSCTGIYSKRTDEDASGGDRRRNILFHAPMSGRGYKPYKPR
ncbi:hypothetical protein FJZ19_03420 [Candidatus Pacearchaeota archaeon]|nr:hypothetical protein [Candidatus Pacearchaeota archaeon]